MVINSNSSFYFAFIVSGHFKYKRKHIIILYKIKIGEGYFFNPPLNLLNPVLCRQAFNIH